jgi:hypothetical protein
VELPGTKRGMFTKLRFEGTRRALDKPKRDGLIIVLNNISILTCWRVVGDGEIDNFLVSKRR